MASNPVSSPGDSRNMRISTIGLEARHCHQKKTAMHSAPGRSSQSMAGATP